MYALCVSGAVNTQGFCGEFFYALYVNVHSFIHDDDRHYGGGGDAGGGDGDGHDDDDDDDGDFFRTGHLPL